MSRIFKSLTRVEDALDRFFAHIPMTPTETVELEFALGRVLAEDIYSPLDVPRFDRAAFDGYAVRSEDTFGASPSSPVTLRVIGSLRPGDTTDIVVGKMESVKIATGAFLPNGTDAVVPLEYSKEIGREFVEISRQVPPGANVDRTGSDVRRGDLVLRQGTYIGPFEMLLLATLNVTKVLVRRRPRVSIINTGNEIVELGSDLSGGKVVNSIRYMLISLLHDMVEINYRGIAHDDEDLLRKKILDCLDDDLIVTTAGTSVGERDLVPRVVEDLGGNIIAHGLSIMPGKPTLMAIIDGTPLIGLPGYPVSAAVTSFEVLIPTIGKMLGIRGKPIYPKVKAILTRRIASRPGVRHYVRVKLDREKNKLLATPVRVGGSGIISSLTEGDGFVVVPEDLEGYEDGEVVEVLVYKRWLEL